MFDQQSRRFLYLDGPCEQLLGLSREPLLAAGDAWQRALELADHTVATTLQRDLELHGQVNTGAARGAAGRTAADAARRLGGAPDPRSVGGRRFSAELGSRECSPENADMDRLAVERTHEGVAITDAAGSVRFLNREHLGMFGYDWVEELIGQSWRVTAPAEVEDTTVMGPAEGMERVVSHLVDNAFQFSLPGSTVQVAARPQNSSCGIGVQEAGWGMSEAEMARIGAIQQFGRDRFEQQGIGMGLVLARSFARLGGGDFSVERNQRGVGLTARLTRPVQVASVRSQAGPKGGGAGERARSNASPAEAVGPGDRGHDG